MRRIAVSYGSNAVPVMGGTVNPNRVQHQSAAVPMPGSGMNLPTETPVEKYVGCSGITKFGEPCKARTAKGTEWCVGHLRSRGEL